MAMERSLAINMYIVILSTFAFVSRPLFARSSFASNLPSSTHTQNHHLSSAHLFRTHFSYTFARTLACTDTESRATQRRRDAKQARIHSTLNRKHTVVCVCGVCVCWYLVDACVYACVGFPLMRGAVHTVSRSLFPTD